jgi:hypothetical protein
MEVGSVALTIIFMLPVKLSNVYYSSTLKLCQKNTQSLGVAVVTRKLERDVEIGDQTVPELWACLTGVLVTYQSSADILRYVVIGRNVTSLCSFSHSYLVPVQANPLRLYLSGYDGPNGQQQRGYVSRIKPQLSVSHVTIWQLRIISAVQGFQQWPCPLTPTLISSDLKFVGGMKIWFVVST